MPVSSQVSGGSIAAPTPTNLASFALGSTFGVPHTVWIAVPVLLLVTILVDKTVMGRRFLAAGVSPAAARAAGIRVRSYQVGTYVCASVCAAAAGVLLAGFLGRVSLFGGTDYLMPSIAAVVLGGTSLAGGAGSVVATAVGALFLTQLGQVVLGMGMPASGQYIVQGAVIALAVSARRIPART